MSELSGNLEDAKEEIDEKISETNTNIMTALMLPDWSACISIGKPSSYTVPANGYILINPQAQGAGNMTVNGTTVYLKYRGHENDNAAQLVPYPVKKGDIVTCAVNITAVYFLPVVEEIKIEDEEDTDA